MEHLTLQGSGIVGITNGTYTVSQDAIVHDTFLGNRIDMRKQAEPQQIERRYYTATDAEFRASDDGKSGTLRGYALRFGSVYDMGWFTEEVDRRALDNADMKDVRVLLNHDPNQILGRTAAGTATVGVDEKGMWYEVQLPESPNGQNARVAIERGDITQSSWGFMLRVSKDGNGDRWEKRDGKEHRILTDVRAVYDASPVTFPANPDTDVAKRSFQGANIENRAELADSWDIYYVIDNSAWALSRANEMIASLNSWIQRYESYAQMTGVEDVFASIANDCRTAKSALVSLINGHTQAITTLNQLEGRATENNKETRTTETQNTEIEIDLALLERHRFSPKHK